MEAARLSVVVDANIGKASAGLSKVDGQFKKAGASAASMDRQMKASAASATGAGKSYASLGTTVGKTNQKVQESAPAMSKGSAAAAKLGSAARNTRSGLSSLAGGMSGTQVGAIGLAYGLGKSIKSAADFDSSMRNVNSIAGLSETSFQNLKAKVLDLSGPTAQAPQTLAAGMYDLVSTGYKTNEALRLMKVSAIAATAGLTDTATTTSVMTGVLRSYNLKASEASQVSDDLFQTVNLGKINFEQLAQGIGPVLPMATALGVNLKQVGAAIALMTYQGVPAAESFTYLKGAMTQMVKPSKELKGVYHDLGVKSGPELIRKTGDLQSALQTLYKQVGGDKEKFAELFPDVRGLTAALQLTGKHAGESQKFLKGFNKDAGMTNKVFREQSKGEGFVWKTLGSDIQRAAIDLGGNFTPKLKKMGDGLHDVFALAHKNKDTVNTALKATASPISLPIKGISNALKGGAGGAGYPNIKSRITLDAKQPYAEIAKTRKGLASIPGVTFKSIHVKSDADVVMRKVRTQLTASMKPIKITTTMDRKGNAATVVKPIKLPIEKPKPIRITADASSAKSTATGVKGLFNGIKPKPLKLKASSNAAAVASAAQASLNAVNDKTVRLNIISSKTSVGAKGAMAKGGTSAGGVYLVGEQGPELAALPNGTHVYTASQTRSMLDNGGIDGAMAKGGKVKGEKRRKRLDKIESKAQRKLSTLDYRNSTGDLGDAEEEKRLRSISGTKNLRTDTKRDAKTRLFELLGSRKNALLDTRSQAAQIGASPAAAAQIQKDMAKRHLDEAIRAKDSQAVAQAELELKQATNDLGAVMKQQETDSLDAGIALAKLTPAIEDDIAAQQASKDYWTGQLNTLLSDNIDDKTQGAAIAEAANAIASASETITAAATAISTSITELKKTMDESNRITIASHGVIAREMNGGFADWIKGQLGGGAAMSQRTLGPAASW